jgi:hypothetical protein
MAGKETELTPNITQSYLDAMVDLDKLFDWGQPFTTK